MRSLLILLSVASLWAADQDFNGKWDITVPGEARHRAWWLGVEGAGTPHPKGSFVGAPGGQVDEITDLSIKDGLLQFSFRKPYRIAPGERNVPRTVQYQARIENGQLVGSYSIEGLQTRRALTFTGVRAPV